MNQSKFSKETRSLYMMNRFNLGFYSLLIIDQPKLKRAVQDKNEPHWFLHVKLACIASV